MSAVLNPQDADRVVRGYQQRIGAHGLTHESLNSGSVAKQAIRHAIHTTAVLGECPAVLDIGCGLGDFYGYLKHHGRRCRFTGYDIVPEYVAECRRRYPDAVFQERSIFEDGIEGTYDTIVMSQVLNNRYEASDNLEVMKTALRLAFAHTRVAVSVDMMSSHVDYQNPILFYYPPEDIFRFAKTLARRVALRHDYRPFEFSIQLFHDDAPGYVP